MSFALVIAAGKWQGSAGLKVLENRDPQRRGQIGLRAAGVIYFCNEFCEGHGSRVCNVQKGGLKFIFYGIGRAMTAQTNRPLFNPAH
jgi:hypothetical protein